MWLCWVFVSAHVLSLAAVRGLPILVAASLVGLGLQSPRGSAVAASRHSRRGSRALECGLSSRGHRLTCPAAHGAPPDQGGSPWALPWQGESQPRCPGEPHARFLSRGLCASGVHAQLSYLFCAEALTGPQSRHQLGAAVSPQASTGEGSACKLSHTVSHGLGAALPPWPWLEVIPWL